MLAIISRHARMIVICFICLFAVFAGCSSTPRPGNLQASVQAAENTLSNVQKDPKMKWLGENMRNAKAVLIVTSNARRCVVLARDEGTGKWAGPAFYQVTKLEAGIGGVHGFRAVQQDLELVALAMSDKALNWFMRPTLPGKGGLTIVSGTDGTSGGAPGTADILMFNRSKGANDTGNLQGTILSIDAAGNEGYYGRPVTPADILLEHSVSNPAAAPLLQAAAE